MEIAAYVEALEMMGVNKLICLRRQNYLRQVISGRNGGRRGQFGSRAGNLEALPPLQLPTVDVVVDPYRGSLLEHFERWDRLYEELEKLTQETHFSLICEDHTASDPLVGYRIVETFFGLRLFEPQARFAKLSAAPPVSEMISNVDEVRQHLAGSSYLWMVDE
jgi:hypothetical protein